MHFGAMMVRQGLGDGFISGAAHATADVCRAVFRVIGISKEVKIASSFSLMQLPVGISHHIGCETASWFGFALAVQARVGRGRVVPVRLVDLRLPTPRPRDARLTPATLPGWRAGVDELLRGEASAGRL